MLSTSDAAFGKKKKKTKTKQIKNSSHVKKTNKMTKASRRLGELSFLTEPSDKEVNEVQ